MSKVLVIGDSCEDIFIYGNCKRLSPEAPVPVLNPIETISNRGMSVNVYNNIKALGMECDLYTNNERPSKTRFVDKQSNQTLLRVDEYDEINHIVANLNEINYTDYDAVVICDYNKGYLTEDDIKFITRESRFVFLDSKKKLGDWCKYVDVIKINEKEYLENSQWLDNNFICKLIVTLGSRGSRYNNEIFPIEEEHPVRDLSGAGDTYLAALVVEFLNSYDIKKAIQFANKCSSWVVTQKGVTVVDISKIK
jgi:bifunctional ADP-heptose synthase (sugar kinase/adenylyltransferase)